MAKGLNEKYFYNKGFDQTKLVEGIANFLPKHVPDYAPTAQETSLAIINRLASDARVTDIRYMAYMLATACHETRRIASFQAPKKGKDGKQLLDPKTKVPLTKSVRLWTIFNPIEEMGHGKGKDYFEPVKVEKTVDGALITEKDGDQFKVALSGVFSKAISGGSGGPGSTSGDKASKLYQDAAGAEQQYFGRGLVQLTWWYNYANVGNKIGMGLDLLLNPEKLLDAGTSYEVMVYGMTQGKLYGNYKKCSDYFTDGSTDYVKARGMINGTDKASEIAALALAFETLLTNSRKD
jgi:hypothetical protein